MAYKYDLALSFAGEQRDIGNTLAHRLDSSGYSIFYDKFEEAELWGRDLSIDLENIYSKEARYCLIILSQAYLDKPWTNHERQSAIGEFIRNRKGYILCLKVEDVKLPGYPSVNSYVSLKNHSVDSVYGLLLQTLGNPNHKDQISHLNSEDCSLARQIIEACFRRAVYTRMDSEIDMKAMYSSIGDCLAIIQPLSAQIHDQALQYNCQQIIVALDNIERTKLVTKSRYSYQLVSTIGKEIDVNKQKVVDVLLEIRRAAKIPMQMPFTLRTDHFIDKKGANEKPRVEFNIS